MSSPVRDAIAQCGGEARLGQLVGVVTRHQIRTALVAGFVVRIGHGRYALKTPEDPVDVAARLCGVVSHRSAAVLHGWEVRSAPDRPDIIVPRTSSVSAARRRDATVRWRGLEAADVHDRVTSPLRTVIDCARDLPLPESLAVADSALRAGDLTHEALRAALVHLPRSRRGRAALVLRQASPLAANPFESALRAHSIEAVGPVFAPQVPVPLHRGTVYPDLVSEELRIVIEADSHTFHTRWRQLNRDCWRYDELVLAEWMVLRFSWEQVMMFRSWVQDVIRRGVAAQRHRLAA